MYWLVSACLGVCWVNVEIDRYFPAQILFTAATKIPINDSEACVRPKHNLIEMIEHYLTDRHEASADQRPWDRKEYGRVGWGVLATVCEYETPCRHWNIAVIDTRQLDWGTPLFWGAQETKSPYARYLGHATKMQWNFSTNGGWRNGKTTDDVTQARIVYGSCCCIFILLFFY